MNFYYNLFFSPEQDDEKRAQLLILSLNKLKFLLGNFKQQETLMLINQRKILTSEFDRKICWNCYYFRGLEPKWNKL